MSINLIQTKPNEYAYLNDIELTVIETNSNSLCPPDSTIKEIISKESHLKVLNKKLKTTKQHRRDLKIDIIIHEILNVVVYGGCTVIYLFLAGCSVPTITAVLLAFYFMTKGLQMACFGTIVGKLKKFKEAKKQFKLKEEEIEKYEKEIEELKKEIGYKVIVQMPIEEYERRCRIWELERNNKLPNTKYYFYNNDITIEKYMKIGQKKRR